MGRFQNSVATGLVLVLASACGNGGGGTRGDGFGGAGNSGLTVSGAGDLDASGVVGGPFGPPVTYTVSNVDSAPLQWEVRSTVPWIQFSVSSGTLLSTEAIPVTVSVDESVAASFSEGPYSGAVVFSDLEDASADIVMPATLNVLAFSADPPVVTAVVPATGPPTGGNPVSLSGSGFQDNNPGTNAVTFGGQQAGNVVVVNDTLLTCDAPVGLPSSVVDIFVTNDNGTATLPGGYAYSAGLSLASVAPVSGPAAGGNAATLTGTGFLNDGAGTNVVTFDGTPATNVVVVSDTSITCVVPAGAPGASVDVSVSNNNGTVTLPGGYDYHALPSLSAVAPSNGLAAGGNTVTLTGTGFQNGSPGVNAVTFGGNAASNVVVSSDNSLTCVVPPGTAGSSVDIALSNLNGDATLPGGYSYQGVLTLSAVNPPSGPDTGGNNVTLTGTGFQNGVVGPTTVTFGASSAANIVVVDDTTLTCDVPPGAAGSVVDVSVSNDNGSVTLAGGYGYQAVAEVFSVNPPSGPAAGGDNVTITGAGFQIGVTGPNVVTFGGNPATNVVVLNDATLTCDVPAGAAGAAVDVVITNDNGTATLSPGYSYHALPSLTAIVPPSGPAAGGGSVTLSGSGFVNDSPGVNTVTIGGQAAANVVVVNDTTIQCDVPAGTPGSSVDVVVSNDNGAATLSNGYDYHALPSLAAVNPPSGPDSGGNTVVLTGSGFQDDNPGVNTVTFGAVSAGNVSVLSDTSLECDVPPGAAGAFVDVALSNSNGSSTLPNGYEYFSVVELVPLADLSSSGEEGGPFTPDSGTYTLTNNGASSFDWSVSLSDTIFFVDGPTAGTLSGGQSVNITLRVAAIAFSLTPGIYPSTATFTNTTAAEVIGTRDAILAVNSTVDGWTDFSPSVDTRMIYVSNSGNDTNDGLSPSTPKRTIAAGYGLLRDGFPDWLLLERGSTWSTRTNYRRSGRSSSEKTLLRDYGDPAQPRPTILGADVGLSLGSGPRHLAIVGLRIVDSNREGIDGTLVNDVLIEDCYIDNSGTGGIVFTRVDDDGPRNVTIRRTIIRDCGRSGILTSGSQNMLIEECIFFNNGAVDDIREHNIYMSGGDPNSSFSNHDIKPNGNTVRKCILLQAIGNYGIKWRVQDNGLIERNVFARNRNTIEIHTKHPEEVALNNTFRENVVLEGGNNITSSGVRGLDMRGVQSLVVNDNIWSRNPVSQGNPVMTLGIAASGSNPDNQGEYFPSPEDITISNNIVYGWNGPYFSMNSQPYGTNAYRNVRIENNDFQLPAPDLGSAKELVRFSVPVRPGADGVIFSNNRYYSQYAANTWFAEQGQNMTYAQWVSMSGEAGSSDQQTSYSDPDRDLGTYAATLGIGSSYNSYVNALMQQERSSWNELLMAEPIIDYVRAGFDKPALTP